MLTVGNATCVRHAVSCHRHRAHCHRLLAQGPLHAALTSTLAVCGSVRCLNLHQVWLPAQQQRSVSPTPFTARVVTTSYCTAAAAATAAVATTAVDATTVAAAAAATATYCCAAATAAAAWRLYLLLLPAQQLLWPLLSLLLLLLLLLLLQPRLLYLLLQHSICAVCTTHPCLLEPAATRAVHMHLPSRAVHHGSTQQPIKHLGYHPTLPPGYT
jgi:hypothetical protein